MTAHMLQVNFNFSSTRAEYEAFCQSSAASIAGIPNLNWKIWLMNETENEAGGIYCFAKADAAAAFARDLETMLHSTPGLSKLSIKQFGVLEAPTAITRGPVTRTNGAVTFGQMAATAAAAIPSLGPEATRQRMTEQPDTLVIDVRDAADIAETGTVPGAVNLSYGALTYLADSEVPESWRDPRLADRSRPIITTCILGPLGAMGGKLLHDMGFTDVSVLEGGVQAWIDAGLPVVKNGSS
jgi:rhodanese-related sulfurtransferase